MRADSYNRRLMSSDVADMQPRLADLLGDVTREIDISMQRRIFCNRNLRMDSLEYIGFDMDYTLALYHQERMESLSIRLTLENLIRDHDYPEAIRDLSYQPAYAIRGLAIDRKLGNVFKMDRHGYIGRVYHGFRQLTKEERRRHYRHERINPSHKRYAWIDTLFALPEAVMYITLVDFLDRTAGRVDYRALFDHIRSSIDKAHRDDTLKTVIKANLPEYIIKDEQLGETLHKLRSSGKKLFLLTNSYYPYTEAVMTYLLDERDSAYDGWKSYFDVIIVGGCKPGFFNKREPFRVVDQDSRQARADLVVKLQPGQVYQGGNIIDFERMTGARGERVLYIGDHIYGDILRLKKSHVWRTTLVLQELDDESAVGARMDQRVRDLAVLDRRRRNLESEIDYEVLMIKRLSQLLDDVEGDDHARRHADLAPQLEEARAHARETLDKLRVRARLMEEEVEALDVSIEKSYNRYWGPMFREGNENSRFGKQVADYADLYTSRVSNFLSYSPVRYFRAPRKLMPHEL